MVEYIAAFAAVAAAAASIVIWRRRGRRAAAQGKRVEPAGAAARSNSQPISDPAAAAAAPESDMPDASAARTSRNPDEPRHVLIVDDMPAIRMLLAEVLRSAGFIVHEAESGRAAVELAGTYSLDVVLLDLKMPDMDGVEVLEAIRRSGRSAEVHAIMISAYGDGDKIDAARRLGVKRFFTKPFDIEELRDYVLSAAD